jgi:hypothetical protein
MKNSMYLSCLKLVESYISGKNISDIQTKVQEDLNRIELWCKDNNMFINCNKLNCWNKVKTCISK